MYRTGICLVLGMFLGALGAMGQAIGWRVGLVAVWGNPVTRLGIMGDVTATGGIYQLVAGAAVHYNGRQYGPPAKGWEMQSRLGVALGFGPPFDRPGHIPRTFALGYVLNSYLDRIKTSQFTGTFQFRGGPVIFDMENDAFALVNPGDQFRSGAFRLGYRQGHWQVEGLVALWHGRTKGEGITTQDLPAYPGRWGFRDISGGLYGNYSNGVAMLRMEYSLPWGQRVHAGLGIDAEQVRDLFQNRLVHDLRFFPAKWTKVRNPHYPMLDREGCPFLFLPGQEIRRPGFVWELGLNKSGVY